jgi:hypothetical protein
VSGIGCRYPFGYRPVPAPRQARGAKKRALDPGDGAQPRHPLPTRLRLASGWQSRQDRAFPGRAWERAASRCLQQLPRNPPVRAGGARTHQAEHRLASHGSPLRLSEGGIRSLRRLLSAPSRTTSSAGAQETRSSRWTPWVLVTGLCLVTRCPRGSASHPAGRAGKTVRSQAGAWEPAVFALGAGHRHRPACG